MKPLERLLLLAIALVVLIFDVWTVRSNNEPWHFGKKQTDYYNALLEDRKSTRLNSSHRCISYAVFCLKKKKTQYTETTFARAATASTSDAARGRGPGITPGISLSGS